MATPILAEFQAVALAPNQLEGIALGLGLDPVNNDVVSPSPITSTLPAPTMVNSINTGTSSGDSTDTASNYATSLAATMSISGSYGFVSGSAGATVLQSENVSTHSFCVVAHAGMVGDVYALTMDQLGAITISVPSTITTYAEFVKAYGPFFVAGYVTGGSYDGVITMQCDSYATAQALSLNLQANYNGYLASGGIAVAVQSTVSATGGSVKTSYHQVTVGWPSHAPAMQGGSTMTETQLDANIKNFIAAPASDFTTQFAWLLMDWRMIAAVSNLPYSGDGTFNTDLLVPPQGPGTPLAVFQQYLTGIAYTLNSASAAIALNDYVGSANLGILQSYVAQFGPLLGQLQEYTSVDVVALTGSALTAFEATYAYQDALIAIQNISSCSDPTVNGFATVVIEAFVDGTFVGATGWTNPTSPTSGPSGPGSLSQPIWTLTASAVPPPAKGVGASAAGITFTRTPPGQNPETWQFNFLYSGNGQGQVQLVDPLGGTVAAPANWNSSDPTATVKSNAINYVVAQVTYVAANGGA